MISKRQMRKRLRQSTDTSFSAESSTLHERLPALSRAGSGAAPSSAPSRLGRRIAVVVGSIGLVGWVTMGAAGAAVTAAATGVLPDPVQQFVANVVHVVGIDIPDPAQQRDSRQRELGSRSGLDQRRQNDIGCYGEALSGGDRAGPDNVDAGSGGTVERLAPHDQFCMTVGLKHDN